MEYIQNVFENNLDIKETIEKLPIIRELKELKSYYGSISLSNFMNTRLDNKLFQNLIL